MPDDPEQPQQGLPQLNRFHALVEAVAESVERDYAEARDYARRRDPQRAGHQAESTWRRMLERWGNGWPVVSRRYIVGPWGESGEVDLIVLRPDYPPHLKDEAAILVSGVAAAFSCKLTLRRQDILDAINQKRRIIDAGGGPRGMSDEELMHARFSFGLLAHASELGGGSTTVQDRVKDIYDQVAHGSAAPLVTHPSEELDCLLLADTAFFSTMRHAVFPCMEGGELTSVLVSSFMLHDSFDHSGAALAQFVAWLSDLGAEGLRRGALTSLWEMFGSEGGSGRSTVWPSSVLPPF